MYDTLRDKLREFDERHADEDHLAIVDNSLGGRDQVYVFPNGAHRDRHGNLHQDLEAEICIRRRLWYWTKRQEQLRREFEELKAELEVRLASTHQPDKEGLERLKKLQKFACVDCVRQVEQATWELSLHPFRTRKRILNDLREQLYAGPRSLSTQRNHLVLRRHQAVADPSIQPEVDTLEAEYAAAEKDVANRRLELEAEIERVRDMPYSEFLAERRAEDKTRQEIKERSERRERTYVSVPAYMEFKAELETLEL
jgi:hypothetical protein